MEKLTKKEKLFAFRAGMGATFAEAMLQAGMRADAESLCRLLESPAVCAEMEKWQAFADKISCRRAARQGLERIAFGGIGDAVRLAFLEEAPTEEELAGLNLCCVSEIKRPKGGGCEIKLTDRLKALELLASFPDRETAAQAGGFMQALEKSAAAIPSAMFGREEQESE